MEINREEQLKKVHEIISKLFPEARKVAIRIDPNYIRADIISTHVTTISLVKKI